MATTTMMLTKGDEAEDEDDQDDADSADAADNDGRRRMLHSRRHPVSTEERMLKRACLQWH